MFQIAIITSNPQIRDSLFFTTKEKADNAYNNIRKIQKGGTPIEIIEQTDEFGVTISIDKANVLYAIYADLAKQTALQQLLRGPAPVNLQAAPAEAQAEPKIILEAANG